MTAEIIPFPSDRIVRTSEDNSPEDPTVAVPNVKEGTNIAIIEALNAISEELYHSFVELCDISGIVLADKSDIMIKDMGLVAEAIRSLVYKYYSKPHQLHTLSESVFEITKDKLLVYRGRISTVTEEPPKTEDVSSPTTEMKDE